MPLKEQYSPTCDSALIAASPTLSAMYKAALYGLGLAALGVSLLVTPAAAETKSPVVVELFTSQGCSSCPPAEAFLGELAKRPDVLALEFHVDYWDYIGWKDPFGAREHVDRQHGYGARLGQRYVYTPQMVINGQTHEVGSKRYLVEKKIEIVRNTAAPGPTVTLERVGDEVRVRVNGDKTDEAYDIFFVTFDAKHETKILRGENRGQTLVNTNIVRAFDRVGQWSGKPVELMVSLAGKKGDGGCAVIVQAAKHGPIVASALLAYEGR
jgi:hypothetical protein